MELSILGRKRSKPNVPDNSARVVKWRDETRLMIAHYVHENYAIYKTLGETGGKKMDFLRQMRDALQLQCTDKQLKNAFESIIRKYKITREKLNSSGYNDVSEEKSILEKELILRQCPYYEVLDRVMGTEPDIAPPFTLCSTTFGRVDECVEVTTVMPTPPFTHSGSSCGTNADSNDVPQITVSQPFTYDSSLSEAEEKISLIQPSDHHVKEETGLPEEDLHDMNISVQRSPTLLGAKKKKSDVPRNALGAFATIVSKNCEVLKEVEASKLKLETEKFLYAKYLDKKKLEAQKLEQQFELEKIKVQGEIEIQKLRLQIELEKLRSAHQQAPS